MFFRVKIFVNRKFNLTTAADINLGVHSPSGPVQLITCTKASNYHRTVLFDFLSTGYLKHIELWRTVQLSRLDIVRERSFDQI